MQKACYLIKDSIGEIFRDTLFREIGCTNLVWLLESEEFATMQLINQMCENSSACRRDLCIAGLLPNLIRLATLARPIKLEVSYFIA